MAVYEATSRAFKTAREVEDTTLIESYTYRIGPHTTAADTTKYRAKDEEKRFSKTL